MEVIAIISVDSIFSYTSFVLASMNIDDSFLVCLFDGV